MGIDAGDVDEELSEAAQFPSVDLLNLVEILE